ncbi:MAG: hypothetical protein V5B78_12165 [Desulfohalobiaceae bacterium]
MKKVLLAINGITPHSSPFLYALQYCHITLIGLCILQVIDPKRYLDLGKHLKSKVRLANRYLEDIMATAAIAEAGNHDLVHDFLQQGRENIEQAVPREYRQEVPLSLEQRIGDTRAEILSFLESRKDIALAVYDDPYQAGIEQDSSSDELSLERDIPFRLGIPLIKPETRLPRQE